MPLVRDVGEAEPDLDRAGCTWSFLDFAQCSEHVQHRAVLAEHEAGEARDALRSRTRRQRPQELASEPSSLPFVDDGHGELGLLRAVVVAHVPGDADALASQRVDGDERFVIRVVDLREVGQLARRELRLRAQEAEVARLLREVPEGLVQPSGVAGTEGADLDSGSIAQVHHTAMVTAGDAACIA